MIKKESSPRFSVENMVPITDLQRAPGTIVRQARESREPLLITRRGKVEALLMTPEHYSELQSHVQEGKKGERKAQLLAALQQIVPQIVETYQPEKIILFGSLAAGAVHGTSDIDLLIIKKTTKRPLDRQKELMEKVDPRIATDFFIYTPEEFARGLREKRRFFVEEIVEKGKVLYDQAA